MPTSGNVLSPKRMYHRNAYEFIFDALRYTQETLNRSLTHEDETAHISGQELLEGVRLLAQEKYGLLAHTVFKHWGINSTEDFGRIVFELVDRGEMRKTERDQLSDFVNIYDFHTAFDEGYTINVREAFKDR